MVIDEYGTTEGFVITEGPTGVIVGEIRRSSESVPIRVVRPPADASRRDRT